MLKTTPKSNFKVFKLIQVCHPSQSKKLSGQERNDLLVHQNVRVNCPQEVNVIELGQRDSLVQDNVR